ncbi:MAG: hypothetical protein ACI8ZX_002627, partial [Planctomycetota bacterium]
MSQSIIKINSISELHAILGLEKPTHPLVSLIDAKNIKITENELNTKIIYNFFMVSLKDKSCGMQYGRNSFDFDEGVMAFAAPGQVYSPTETVELGEIKGWMLIFHPDLIRNTNLGKQIEDYSFFDYQIFEALHLSESEENTVNNCVVNIQAEYEQRIDDFSQRVLVSNIELLLNYSLRYYERQFNTRTSQNKGIVSQFKKELKN